VQSRILTGLLLLGLGGYLVANGGLPLYIFIFLVTMISAYELVLMSKPKLNLFQKIMSVLAASVVMVAILPLAINNGISADILAIVSSVPVKFFVLFMIAFYLAEILLKKKFIAFDNQYYILLRIILLLVGTFPFIFLVRAGNNGFFNMLFCCVLIWVADIAALFGGMKWGRHKLSKLSPKKTVEGSLIAIVADLIAALIFIWLFKLNPVVYLALAFIISILAQLGDLHESLTKRYFNVKDSSGLLPGHGGIYDRVDSSLFVMPLMFYFFNW